MSATEIDTAKLEAFMGQVVTDMGAVISAPLMVIGEKLGLYKAMAGAGPLTSAELAERTGVAERSVREWLRNQAAGGYVSYDSETDTLHAPRRARARARRRGEPRLRARRVRADRVPLCRRGPDHRGVPHRRGDGLARARPPPLPRHRAVLPARLQGPPGRRMDPRARRCRRRSSNAGAKVADVGCGHGASTIIMAEAFPNSEFLGFDYHDGSIEQAAKRGRGSRRRRPDQVRGRRRPRTSPAATTTSSACSTASTTWATPSARAQAHPQTLGRRRHLDDRRAVRRGQRQGQPEPGRDGSSTGPRPSSARPPRSPRRSGSHSAPRPAKRSSPR